MTLDITQKRANQIRGAFSLGTSNINSIECYSQGDHVYMTVDRRLIGVTEYRIIEDNPKTNDEVIKLQLEFVDWLKSNNLYNQMDTAYTMRKMQSIWEAMK